MYQLKIEQEAKKQLAKIPKVYQDKILVALPIIQQDPFSGKKLEGKLQGLRGPGSRGAGWGVNGGAF